MSVCVYVTENIFAVHEKTMQISNWSSMCMLVWSRYFDTLYFYFFFEEVILISLHHLCCVLTVIYTAMNESAPNGDGKCTHALFFPIRHVWKSLAFERLKCHSVEFLYESLVKIQCNQQHREKPFTRRPVRRRLLKLKPFNGDLMSVNMDRRGLFSCAMAPYMLTSNQIFTYVHVLKWHERLNMSPGFTR